jgi:hypothetical protein
MNPKDEQESLWDEQEILNSGQESRKCRMVNIRD